MTAALDEMIQNIHSDDAYLADAWLERLRLFAFNMHAAARFLLWLPNIKPHLSCSDIHLCHGETDLGRPADILAFHTGGCSGAEDLINAMLGHFWIEYFQTQWRRGGHFTFEIPAGVLAPPCTPPDAPG